jgi:putative intracellular protease/amidase
MGERGTGVRPLFEGFAVLLRGYGASAVQKWVAQCHEADTGLTAQCRTVAGMASPGGLAEQRQDTIPKRVRDGMAWIRL